MSFRPILRDLAGAWSASWLFDNRLSGEIPSELGSLTNLTNLKYLFLYGNRLTGEIPSELAGQSALPDLYLEGNSFSGCNPVGLQDVENNDLDLLGLIYCTSLAS